MVAIFQNDIMEIISNLVADILCRIVEEGNSIQHGATGSKILPHILGTVDF